MNGEEVFIALGSNVEPEENLPAAVKLLSEQVHLVRVSSVWETPAWGNKPHPAYLNAAVLMHTTLPPAELKTGILRSIETELGRTRDPLDKNAARTIDLDIALYGQRIVPGQIPDPDITQRNFLAVPLAELAPDFVHPVTGNTLSDIAADLPRDNMKLRPDVQLTIETR